MKEYEQSHRKYEESELNLLKYIHEGRVKEHHLDDGEELPVLGEEDEISMDYREAFHSLLRESLVDFEPVNTIGPQSQIKLTDEGREEVERLKEKDRI
ncbi:MAG: hypothetical protein ABEJ72_08190 [Candidatus Aenigmatarchaeota archaeon]